MEIKNLPEKYKRVWIESLPILLQGRPGDDLHAKEVAELVLSYKGKLPIDKDILVPCAIMHDIGHGMILPEHFKFISGGEKIANAKLVHMLVGAKIAKDILDRVGYDPEKTKEIVEIIATHDGDQIKGAEPAKVYDTENKKIFHDIDSLDRFTADRVKSMSHLWPGKDIPWLLNMLRDTLKDFSYDEFKQIAIKRLESIEKDLI